MLQTFRNSVDRRLWIGMLACSVFLTSGATSMTLGQELDPLQKDWIAKYEKQDNAPQPGDMLLNTDAEPDLSTGFTALFNGTDLTGWNPKGGTCTFEVQDGQIVGTCVPGSNSTYLSTDKNDFTDFVFTCDLKWEVNGNTGVQFRSQSKPGAAPKKGKQNKPAGDAKPAQPKPEIVFGPQFEMEGLGKQNRHWSGGIYGQSCGGYFYPLWLKEHQAARAAEKTDDWNRITISAQGNVVKTWLNGVPVAHWVGDDTYSSGFFALQIHKGKAGKVRFKNIRVNEASE